MLAIFSICETLSRLGGWGAALAMYQSLDKALQLAPGIAPPLVAVLHGNRARTTCVVAALAGDAERAAQELTRIRTEVRQPPYVPDRLGDLASDLTTAAIVMQQAPSESLVKLWRIASRSLGKSWRRCPA